MTIRRGYLALVLVLLVAACGGGGDTTAAEGDTAADAGAEEASAADDAASADSEPATDAASEAATDGGAGSEELTTTSTDLGEVLADGDGNVVYVFDNDSGGESSCYDDCATNWPPVTGDVTAGEGVDEAQLGSTERTDGETQATYNDRPLYYYAGDSQPGDVNGQGVGGRWWVVGPDGEAITEEATASATSNY